MGLPVSLTALEFAAFVLGMMTLLCCYHYLPLRVQPESDLQSSLTENDRENAQRTAPVAEV